MRHKNVYFDTQTDLNILTDEEYNELVFIEEVFTILATAIPWDKNSDLSNYISDYLINKNNRSLEIISLAAIRLNNIIKLCTA